MWGPLRDLTGFSVFRVSSLAGLAGGFVYLELTMRYGFFAPGQRVTCVRQHDDDHVRFGAVFPLGVAFLIQPEHKRLHAIIKDCAHGVRTMCVRKTQAARMSKRKGGCVSNFHAKLGVNQKQQTSVGRFCFKLNEEPNILYISKRPCKSDDERILNPPRPCNQRKMM